MKTSRHEIKAEYTPTDHNVTDYDGYLFFIVPLTFSNAVCLWEVHTLQTMFLYPLSIVHFSLPTTKG